MDTSCIPPAGQPELWVARLGEMPLLRAQSLLTSEEHARLLRYRFDADRLRFATGRALVRLSLARHLRCAPAEVRIAIEEGGRPRLDASVPQLAFSLSHAGELVLLAVAAAPGEAIGVDVETGERLGDLDALVGDVCSASEAMRLSAGTPAQREQRFLRLWTLKEAYLKATGEGLARAPRTVVFAGEDGARPELATEGAGWQFWIAEPALHAGHVVALAVRGVHAQLHPRVLAFASAFAS